MKNLNSQYLIRNTQYSRSRKVRKAFTLIEFIIVVGITTILAGTGISTYINQQRAKLLDTSVQEIVSYLRYAQQKSTAQEDGNQWGVHFENPASGNDFYALYTGITYTTPVETKYLPTGITFQTPSSGNSIDMSYEKLTGLLSGSSYQQIILQNT
ncbi:MAG: prepilin-type N-terminal cleavage/methylation domain-containing protein, partial [Candidatus Pacebacteria bacterium]|nr:prepilin-type N-terminal cleavage/methylation domain-containing protein [Candidatus Paceibacterota bacterium]